MYIENVFKNEFGQKSKFSDEKYTSIEDTSGVALQQRSQCQSLYRRHERLNLSATLAPS